VREVEHRADEREHDDDGGECDEERSVHVLSRRAVRVSPSRGTNRQIRRDERSGLTDDPKDVVARAYDAIADEYAAWAATFESPVMDWARRFSERLPPGSRVLELGCGGDNPATRLLVERYEYTGVDLSVGQLERARRAFPGATYLQGDAAQLDVPPESFDGVASLFMFGHVPRAEQEPLLRSIFGWLRPGGLLLATLATSADPDQVVDWFDVPMFFASWSEDENRAMLERTGFVLEDARVVPFVEPGHGLTRFMWVLGSRP
jgi:SAM-dependent methyltransferase